MFLFTIKSITSYIRKIKENKVKDIFLLKLFFTYFREIIFFIT